MQSFKIAADWHNNIKSAGNVFYLDTQLVSNNDNIVIKLGSKTMIKANRRLVQIIIATHKYIKIFSFGKDYFLMQIETIENYKIKIGTKSTAYVKLVTKFLKNKS